MSDSSLANEDVALDALDALSKIAASSAEELIEVNRGIDAMQTRRRHGWSWQRIVSSAGTDNPLKSVAGILANLSRGSGEFRRALARSLRDEEMHTTEIARLLDVTRQRVGALLRPRASK